MARILKKISDILLLPCNTTSDPGLKNNYKNSLVITVSVISSLIFVAIFLAITIVTKKKITTEEEPVVEKNDEYGAYEEYYDEHDNRIEDNNDYYE